MKNVAPEFHDNYIKMFIGYTLESIAREEEQSSVSHTFL